MKFIANSKYLRRRIGHAINSGCNRIEAVDDDILFHGHKLVTVNVHFRERSNVDEFNPIVWAGVYAFLKTIPEQPITISISWGSVEIYSVAVFKSPSWIEEEIVTD